MAEHRVNGAAAPAPSWHNWIDPRRLGPIRSLMVCVPAAAVMNLLGAPMPSQFAVAALAIVPLAGLMGEATERLADHLGPGIGGLLNATFGNAAELIIALFALSRGLDDVVKASITGSVIGNLLLVLGASILAGGVKYPIQKFNKTAAGVGGTMLVLSAVGLLVPALFHHLLGNANSANQLDHKLSVGVCGVLLFTYALYLLFSLRTHRNFFNPEEEAHAHGGEDHAGHWSIARSTITLVIATVFVAWMSEILVGAVEPAGHALGLSGVFMGVIVVAIVGNAAEHSTAVLMARKDKMDLAVGIALGSALQIALFVGPVLVLCSYFRSTPMDLLFSPLEVVAVILAVIIARMVAEDGESNWLEGAMLLMVYAILAVAFYFLPAGIEGDISGGISPP